jgi:hypothetical protein
MEHERIASIIAQIGFFILLFSGLAGIIRYEGFEAFIAFFITLSALILFGLNLPHCLYDLNK